MRNSLYLSLLGLALLSTTACLSTSHRVSKGELQKLVTVAPEQRGDQVRVVQSIGSSDDPEVLLKKHRDRIRNLDFMAIEATELFAQVELEQEREADDFLRRGVIRRATAAEVTRIRTDMRV